MDGWKRNGFKTAKGTDVKNREDIMKLYGLCQKIDVKWVSVEVLATWRTSNTENSVYLILYLAETKSNQTKTMIFGQTMKRGIQRMRQHQRKTRTIEYRSLKIVYTSRTRMTRR